MELFFSSHIFFYFLGRCMRVYVGVCVSLCLVLLLSFDYNKCTMVGARFLICYESFSNDFECKMWNVISKMENQAQSGIPMQCEITCISMYKHVQNKAVENSLLAKSRNSKWASNASLLSLFCLHIQCLCCNTDVVYNVHLMELAKWLSSTTCKTKSFDRKLLPNEYTWK